MDKLDEDYIKELQNVANARAVRITELEEILGMTKEYGCAPYELPMVMKIKEINTMTEMLEKCKRLFMSAPRVGSVSDKPEGVRCIHISDTLAVDLAIQIEEIINPERTN